MATGRVNSRDQVFLNGNLFKIRGPVQRQVANQFAEKTVIGDFSEASDPVLSAITWRNFDGGMGRYAIAPDEQSDSHFREFWHGTVRNDVSGHIFPTVEPSILIGMRDSTGLLNDVTNPTKQGIAYAFYADAVNNTSGALYFVTRDSSSTGHYLNSLIGSSASLTLTYKATLHSAPRDLKSGQVGSVNFLVAAEDSAVQWTRSNLGDSHWFTDSGQAMRSVEMWRDLLWGISASGELFFSNEVSDTATLNWTEVAKSPVVGANVIRRLLKADIDIPGSDDREHLILLRNDGFDIYDRLTERFTPALRLPPSEFGGHDGVAWNGSFFYPYGQSLFQWTPTPQGNVVTNVGIDAKDGLPADRDGFIFGVAASPRQLFITIKKDLGADNSSVGFASLLARTADAGWAEYGSNHQSGAAAAAGSSYATNGYPYVGPVKGGEGSSETYVVIPGWKDANGSPGYPINLSRTAFANSSVNGAHLKIYEENDTYVHLISPWIIADGNQDWVAYRFSVDIENITGYGQSSALVNDSLSFSIGLNNVDSAWTQILSIAESPLGDTAAIDRRGTFEVSFPNDANPVGTPFTSLRWRADWRGIGGNSYDVRRVSLIFQKRPKLREAFTFEIDFSGPQPQGRTTAQTRKLLRDFIKQTTLGEFTFRDETAGDDETHWVTAISPIAREETGRPESGAMQMTVMEVSA